MFLGWEKKKKKDWDRKYHRLPDYRNYSENL